MSDMEMPDGDDCKMISEEVQQQTRTISLHDVPTSSTGDGDTNNISRSEGSQVTEERILQREPLPATEAHCDIPYHAALHHINRGRSNAAITNLLQNLKSELFLYGIPETRLKLNVEKGYISLVDPTRNHPVWVAWQLKKPSNYSSSETRKENEEIQSRAVFRFVDKGNYPKAATDADYEDSRYDRGHCKDFGSATNEEEQEATFFIPTNIFPQNPKNNRGIWQRLEMFCHSVLTKHPEYEYLCFMLPIMKANCLEKRKKFLKTEVIGLNEVLVPTHLGKVVVAIDKYDKTPKYTNAWMIPNETIMEDMLLSYFEVSLDIIQRCSGFELFPLLTVDSLKKGVLCDYGPEDNTVKHFVGCPKGIQIPAQTTNRTVHPETEIEYLHFLASVLFCTFSFGYLPDQKDNSMTQKKIIKHLKRTGLVDSDGFQKWVQSVDPQVRPLWNKGATSVPEFIDGLVKGIFEFKAFGVIDLCAYQNDTQSVQTLQQLYYNTSKDNIMKIPKRLILCLPQGNQKIRLSKDSLVNTKSSAVCSCGVQNWWFCLNCYKERSTIEKSSFCKRCYKAEHETIKSGHCKPQRIVELALKAVICQETKPMTYCATGNPNVPWVLFDVMAQLKGGMPDVKPLYTVDYWLSNHGKSKYEEDPQCVPVDIKPLFASPSFCFYG